MSWRRLVLIAVTPLLVGSDATAPPSDAGEWADFLERWLYGTVTVREETRDESLARIDELQARVFDARDAARAATIYFPSGSAALDETARSSLRAFVKVAAELPGTRFQLAGHCDATGTRTMNDALAFARAEQARRFLVREGIAAERLSARGYGDRVPIASNASAEGRAQNRRVDVRFLPSGVSAPR